MSLYVRTTKKNTHQPGGTAARREPTVSGTCDTCGGTALSLWVPELSRARTKCKTDMRGLGRRVGEPTVAGWRPGGRINRMDAPKKKSKTVRMDVQKVAIRINQPKPRELRRWGWDEMGWVVAKLGGPGPPTRLTTDTR